MNPWSRRIAIGSAIVGAGLLLRAILSGPDSEDDPNEGPPENGMDARGMITEHFSWYEVDPTGLASQRPEIAANLQLAAAKAEDLRSRVGIPLSVTPHGGYDPPDGGFADGYHRKSPTSQHHFGRALDLATPHGMTTAQFHAIAKQQHAELGGGLGLYAWGIHADVRDNVAFWQDTSGSQTA